MTKRQLKNRVRKYKVRLKTEAPVIIMLVMGTVFIWLAVANRDNMSNMISTQEVSQK